jgi:hypothetical protein
MFENVVLGGAVQCKQQGNDYEKEFVHHTIFEK